MQAREDEAARTRRGSFFVGARGGSGQEEGQHQEEQRRQGSTFISSSIFGGHSSYFPSSSSLSRETYGSIPGFEMMLASSTTAPPLHVRGQEGTTSTMSTSSSPRRGVTRLSERSTSSSSQSSSSSSTTSYRVLARLRATTAKTSAPRQSSSSYSSHTGAGSRRFSHTPTLDSSSPKSFPAHLHNNNDDHAQAPRKGLRLSGSFASMSSVGSSTGPERTSSFVARRRKPRGSRSFKSADDVDDDAFASSPLYSPTRRRITPSGGATDGVEQEEASTNKIIFVHAASVYSSYVRTRHKNLRCFPFCGSSHNSHSFCGSPIILAVFQLPKTPDEPLERVPSSEYAVVGMMRSSTSPLPSYKVLMEELERVTKIHRRISAQQQQLQGGVSPSSKEAEAFDECLLDLAEQAGTQGEADMFVIQPHRKWRYEYPLNRHSSEEHVYTVFLLKKDQTSGFLRVLTVTDSPAFRIKSAWKNNTTTVHRPKIDLPLFLPSVIYNELCSALSVPLRASAATMGPAPTSSFSSKTLRRTPPPPLEAAGFGVGGPPPPGYASSSFAPSMFSPQASLGSQGSSVSSGSQHFGGGGWGSLPHMASSPFNYSEWGPPPPPSYGAQQQHQQAYSHHQHHARPSTLAPPPTTTRSSYLPSMISLLPYHRTHSAGSLPTSFPPPPPPLQPLNNTTTPGAPLMHQQSSSSSRGSNPLASTTTTISGFAASSQAAPSFFSVPGYPPQQR